MRIFDHKWFRALLFLVVEIAIIVTISFIQASDPNSAYSTVPATLWAVLTFLSTLCFFLRYDLLGNSQNLILIIIKNLILIIGILFLALNALFSIFNLIDGWEAGSFEISNENIWVQGLIALWFPACSLNLVLYRKAWDNIWNSAAFSFIPILSFVPCYLLCVGSSYLAHLEIFERGIWYGLPATVLGIALCVYQIKQIFGGGAMPSSHSYTSIEGHDETEDEREYDTGHWELDKELEELVFQETMRARNYTDGEWEELKAYSSSRKISFYGRYHRKVRWVGAPTSLERAREEDQTRESLKDSLTSSAESILDGLRYKYSNYDDDYIISTENIQVDIEFIF